MDIALWFAAEPSSVQTSGVGACYQGLGASGNSPAMPSGQAALLTSGEAVRFLLPEAFLHLWFDASIKNAKKAWEILKRTQTRHSSGQAANDDEFVSFRQVRIPAQELHRCPLHQHLRFHSDMVAKEGLLRTQENLSYLQGHLLRRARLVQTYCHRFRFRCASHAALW